jgi:hypothetical protein
MQTAQITDQSVIKDYDSLDVDHVDLSDQKEISEPIDKEAERERLMLNDCKTVVDVQKLFEANPDLNPILVDQRIAEIESAETSKKKK